MKLLFSFLKPQIVFGAGGGGGGSRGPAIKPTGFADQASRMANSQRQLGSQQMPGFNLEDEKDVPSVVKRKPQRDSSPIDAGSGGFMGSFQKSPKSGSSNDGANPLTSGFGSRKEAGNTSQQAAQSSLDLSGIGGVGGKTPSFESQGTSRPVGLPRIPSFAPDLVGGGPSRKQPKTEFDPDRRPPRPRVIGDDFIPRNSDGSPKYTAPDGSPLRRPYDPSTPSRPTPRPGGGKGGGGIALPPSMPQPRPVTPQPRPVTPQPRPVTPQPPADPRPGAPVFDNFPVTPFPDPRRRPPTAPILYGGGKGGAGPRPSRPSAPVPPQPIREFGVPRQGGRPSVPTNDPVAQRPMPVRRQPPLPYGGKGGGARPSMQQRRPQAPFTYYRPKR